MKPCLPAGRNLRGRRRNLPPLRHSAGAQRHEESPGSKTKHNPQPSFRPECSEMRNLPVPGYPKYKAGRAGLLDRRRDRKASLLLMFISFCCSRANVQFTFEPGCAAARTKPACRTGREKGPCAPKMHFYGKCTDTFLRTARDSLK